MKPTQLLAALEARHANLRRRWHENTSKFAEALRSRDDAGLSALQREFEEITGRLDECALIMAAIRSNSLDDLR